MSEISDYDWCPGCGALLRVVLVEDDRGPPCAAEGETFLTRVLVDGDAIHLCEEEE